MKPEKQLNDNELVKISAASCSIMDVVYYIKDSQLSSRGFLFTNISEASPNVRERLLAESKRSKAVRICD